MKNLVVLIIAFLLVSFTPIETPKDSLKKNDNAKVDELRYKLKLGWFTLGSGKVKIAYDAYSVNNRTHNQVDVHTETLGLGNWLSNLDDDYTALIDSETAKSYTSYKDVRLKRGRWEQWNSFDYDEMKIKVKVKDYSRDIPDRAWAVDITDDSYDILGTFLFFKNVDWEEVVKYDSVMIKTFYKRTLYRVGTQYRGIEKIKYNGEQVKAHKLLLLLPDHDELAKDRPVEIWISADENHYPIRIQSRLLIGYAKCELHTINNKEPKFGKEEEDSGFSFSFWD